MRDPLFTLTTPPPQHFNFAVSTLDAGIWWADVSKGLGTSPSVPPQSLETLTSFGGAPYNALDILEFDNNVELYNGIQRDLPPLTPSQSPEHALRIVLTGAWFVFEAFQLHRAAGGDQFYKFYQAIPVIGYIVADTQDFDIPEFRDGADPDAGANVLGWIGWLWATIYAPVMNTLWLAGNWSDASGALKFARAISVGVAALPLTVDTKARYGDVLEKYFGKPFRWVFTIISGIACLYLGLLTLLLLCLAAAHWHTAAWKPVLVAIAYTLVMAFWTNGSFAFMTPHDEGNMGITNFKQFLEGLFLGVFGIFFVAVPAGYTVLVSHTSPGIGLKKYAACKSVALWRKVIALLP